jgi:DNA polymerase III subunit delta'
VTVWDSLVGQHHVVGILDAAARGTGMTHAWLFTGPPGSGRSNAAVAFAAALQCEAAGCGECASCREAMAGSHPDITVRRTDKVVISVDDARQWVRDASLLPVRDRWQVIVVEDSDRLHERANNALLKAIEEPGTKTVWILCAPHPEDVLPTIRSRTRHVGLATPSAREVAAFLTERHGVSPTRAAHAARASQGHIGRARALATDEATRNRRHEVVGLPIRINSLGACMTAASNLVDIANQEAAAQSDRLGTSEVEDLEKLFGEDRKAKSSRAYKAAVGELARSQKQRERRQVLDVVDRSLMDLLSVYRDVLAVQMSSYAGSSAARDTGGAAALSGGGLALVNEEQRAEIEDLARRTTPEENLRRIDAVHAAREQMAEFNTPPQLALEAMMVALWKP